MSVRIHQTIITDKTMARESGFVLAMQGAFLPRSRGLWLVCGGGGGLEHH